MLKNKYVIALVVSILLLFIAVLVVGWRQNDNVIQKENSLIPNPSISPTNKVIQPAKTYTQLVAQYVGKRIQFDARCQAIPNNVTFKDGTQVMFDNRSGDARTITVGGTKYQFAGYGYKVLTLSSGTLPKTLYLSCGAAVNVGQILLQK